jgi:methylmalonyl-CoA mutase cobalamin-binding domain/chain
MTGAAVRAGRVVVGTLGLDQHEVGAMAVARLLMRHGFEVIYLGRFNTPEKMAATAEHEDAEVIGVSIHSWELTAYVDDLVAAARRAGVAAADDETGVRGSIAGPLPASMRGPPR